MYWLGVVALGIPALSVIFDSKSPRLHRPRAAAAMDLACTPLWLSFALANATLGRSWMTGLFSLATGIGLAQTRKYASRSGLTCRLNAHLWMWTLVDGSQVVMHRACDHEECQRDGERAMLAELTEEGHPAIGAECVRCHVTR